MRTITTTTDVYTFAELSEESKEKAIDNLYDINVSYDWWENVYYDAEQVGIKITGFDIDRGSYCKGDFTMSAEKVAQAIKDNHGDMCETYKTADNFLTELNKRNTEFDSLQTKLDKLEETVDTSEENEELISTLENELSIVEDQIEELKAEFEKDIFNDYLSMLRNECEYLTSKEAIIETIEANEYTFTIDGKMKNF